MPLFACKCSLKTSPSSKDNKLRTNENISHLLDMGIFLSKILLQKCKFCESFGQICFIYCRTNSVYINIHIICVSVPSLPVKSSLATYMRYKSCISDTMLHRSDREQNKVHP